MKNKADIHACDSPLIMAWRALVKRHRDTVAVLDAESRREWCFDDIAHESVRLAKDFAIQSIRGRGVVLHLPNSPHWFCWFLAIRNAGAVVIPVDVSLPPERAKAIATRFKAAAIIDATGIHRAHQSPRHWKAGCAVVKLTSGSTGEPKGIVFTDTEMLADATNIMGTMGFDAKDRNLCLHPLGHSYALGNVVYPLLGFAVGVVLGSSSFPSAIAEDIAVGQATVMPTVPVVLEALCKSQVMELAKLRLVISAAAPLKPELAKNFQAKFGLTAHNFYGSSETGGIAYDRAGDLGLSGDGVGQVLKGVDVQVNPQGRLTVTSHAISHYGSKTPPAQPCTLALADCGGISDEGNITLAGRSDRMVKIGGRRVDLDALERDIAREVPALSFAVCVVRETLMVIVAGRSEEAEQVRSVLRKIYPYRVSLKSLPSLPMTLRGKVDRQVLMAIVSEL